MVNQQLSTNTFGTAKWIVSATLSDGTHSTIAAALTAASSGDTIFIRPGTYTENLTLKAGVNLVAYTADALTPNVTIVGKAAFTAAGTVSISGIRLQTNSDFLLAVTGSAASVVNIDNCYLNCSNNTGISFTSSSSSSAITITNTRGDLGTTGIAYWASSSTGGILTFVQCILVNSGGSSTNNTFSSSSVGVIKRCDISGAITTSGTAAVTIQNSFLTTPTFTAVTHNATGSAFTITNSVLTTSTASAISIGAGATASLTGKNLLGSTNANIVTGAGIVQYNDIAQTTSPGAINAGTNTGIQNNMGSLILGTPLVVASGGSGASTLTGVLTGNGTSAVTANAVTEHGVVLGAASNAVSSLAVAATGTVLAGSTAADPAFTATPAVTSITLSGGSALSAYVDPTSWTPSLTFGGAAVGITYGAQTGSYIKIGKMVYYVFQITLTSKGSSTGAALISGLPFTSANDGILNIGSVMQTNLLLTALYTWINCYVVNNTTTIKPSESGSAGATTQLTNASFQNSCTIYGSGTYYTA